ncbi:MAG TPA: M1 family peptidase, partial [Bacteroidota bacterium]|nr:M1 family peptidase [Bacteroidota bacterium]
MKKMMIEIAVGIVLPIFCALAQVQTPLFTRADSLSGMLSPERTCYDLTYYHLDVKIDPADSSVRGSNAIYFKVVKSFDRMQIDLFKNMKIEKIVLDDGHSVPFTREWNAVFIQFPHRLEPNAMHHITVFYGGMPIVAKRPPWDGGMTWEKDSAGNPWVVVTSQGTGASLWWP